MAILHDARLAGKYADHDETYKTYITLADDLNRLPTDAEFDAFLDGRRLDEPPALPESDWFEPDPEDELAALALFMGLDEEGGPR